MKLVYSRRSQSDITGIFDYISKQDLTVALAVEADIRLACETLAAFPYANSPTDTANVFRLPLPRRGFTNFYRVDQRRSLVEIARVVRSSRVRNLRRIPR